MSNKIEEAARALRDKIKKEDCCYMELEEFKVLDKLLDPKPSREEVISRLQNYNDWRRGAEHSDGRTPDPKKLGKTIDYAIELLQEPQKGVWIKNTGVEPDCNLVLIEAKYNKWMNFGKPEKYNWALTADNYGYECIVKYMIIE